MRTFEQFLLQEMPKYYSGDVVYQKDTKFTPISVRNVGDYIVLGALDDYLYTIHPNQEVGYVFSIPELQAGKQTVLPVMRVSLRDTPIKNYKQAYFLRIREAFSKQNVTSTWYELYVDKYKGIVSDKEHLEGGQKLWKSFIKKASVDPSIKIYSANIETGDVIDDNITTQTPEDQIWSTDNQRLNTVLVFEKH